MSKKEEYEAKAEALIMPILDSFGFSLYDSEYVKEAGSTLTPSLLNKGLIIKAVEVVGSKGAALKRSDYSLLDHAGGAPHSLVPVDSLVHKVL